ncbi:MAG TPA: DUF1360 domain-containing protein [Verrucomicrobiae bacterium]|jgi:hypothetical protein
MPHWSPSFRLVVAILAVWRVSHLIAREDGPFDVIIKIRASLGNGMLGRLMDCPHCLGLWIAAPFGWWVGSDAAEYAVAVAWLAIAGGASLIEHFIERNTPTL